MDNMLLHVELRVRGKELSWLLCSTEGKKGALENCEVQLGCEGVKARCCCSLRIKGKGRNDVLHGER